MNELSLIRDRVTELLYRGYLRQAVQTGVSEPDLLDSLTDSGYWSDIDYTDTARTYWKPVIHCERLLEILRQRGRAIFDDAAAMTKIITAVEYFANGHFTSQNWWYNRIGMPRVLADVAVLLGDRLPQEILDRVLPLLRQGCYADIPDIMTGANRIWLGTVTLRIALLTDDTALMRLARDRIADEVRFCGGDDGVQPDGSFFQHGKRLYSGGYGRAYAYDMSQLIYLFGGTSYAFTSEQCAVVVSHLADGLRYMTQSGVLDYQCVGREYVRRDALNAGSIRYALELLCRTPDLPRRDELAAYLDELNGKRQDDKTRYYPYAAMLCHHTNGLYVGAKFLSGSLLDEEICNSEGVLGYNMSYGTHTCAMVSGREYLNIAPLWRYDRIPGTTSRSETDEVLLSHPTAWARRTVAEGGGRQDGDTAVIYEHVVHETVSGYTADFAFPGGFVCLNAGFTDSENMPLVTTVEQNHAADGWYTEGDSVIHAGIRYTPLDGSKLIPSIIEVTGSWRRNSLSQSDEPVTGRIFLLTVEGGNCAYMISPANLPVPSVRLLSNTPESQSVELWDGRILSV